MNWVKDFWILTILASALALIKVSEKLQKLSNFYWYSSVSFSRETQRERGTQRDVCVLKPQRYI